MIVIMATDLPSLFVGRPLVDETRDRSQTVKGTLTSHGQKRLFSPDLTRRFLLTSLDTGRVSVRARFHPLPRPLPCTFAPPSHLSH